MGNPVGNSQFPDRAVKQELITEKSILVHQKIKADNQIYSRSNIETQISLAHDKIAHFKFCLNREKRQINHYFMWYTKNWCQQKLVCKYAENHDVIDIYLY